jgi:glycosyltransferase involved in cell wall biosynthesis
MIFPLLFWFSIAFVAYILFGYPLLLRVLAGGTCVRKDASAPLPTVTVLIAVCDGERWVRNKLLSVLGNNYPRKLMQVVVVSDGSRDRTEEIVSEFAHAGVQLMRVERGGKAAAVNAGMKRATGDVVVLTDIRQPLDPDCIRSLAAAFSDPSVGSVSAQLVTLKGEGQEEASLGLYWRYDLWMRSQLSRIHSTFGTNGPCYAVRRELCVPLPQDVILDDVYLPLAGYFRGYRIVLDEHARCFDYAMPLDVEFGRKVRTLAGLYQIVRFYPGILLPGHPMWFHFLSHKFLRLLLPYVLLLAAVSVFFLPRAWCLLGLAAQLSVYGLAGVDRWIPETVIFKRLSSPARVFVGLMMATACAVKIFFMAPRKIWKITTLPSGGQPATNPARSYAASAGGGDGNTSRQH